MLALEDGSVYRGRSFGAAGERAGEVVFNTTMTGYQEVLTDPSYRGQIVVMTCPEIGNTGANPVDLESGSPQIQAFVVREIARSPSSWRANQDLHHYLREHGVPGISEVDTRAVTRRIRERGALRGVVSSVERRAESLVRQARETPALEEQDLVRAVTCSSPYSWTERRPARFASPVSRPKEGGWRPRCAAVDLGAKRTIFSLLTESGFDVLVLPATASGRSILDLEPDVVFLSNGPGDPATSTYVEEAVREIVGKVPIFGICLGHQIAARAIGARTFKLKFGHRGANHPVKDLRTGKVSVTSQNHGYAVAPETLPSGAEVTHVNLNDGTCEGFVHEEAGLFAVQYHPEASPGPHDSLPLFGEFRERIRRPEERRAAAREDLP